MMKEVLQNSDLTIFPVVAVVIFGGSFLLMLAWTFRSGSTQKYNRMASLMLEERTPDV